MTPEQMQALGVPAEFHGEKMFQDAPDLPTVFKVARDLNAYKGNSIRVPGPEAPEADRTEFIGKLKKHAPTLIELPTKDEEREAMLLERLGVPKDEKEYKGDLSDEVMARLRAEAKEEKLTPKQFERRVAREKDAITARTAKETENMAALKKDLGAAFEERLTSAAAAAKNLGASAEEVEAIRTGKAPVDVSRRFLAFAKALGTEPGDLGGHSGPGGVGKLTPDEIQTRIAEIYANPAWKSPADPQFKALNAKLYEYNTMLHPEDGD